MWEIASLDRRTKTWTHDFQSESIEECQAHLKDHPNGYVLWFGEDPGRERSETMISVNGKRITAILPGTTVTVSRTIGNGCAGDCALIVGGSWNGCYAIYDYWGYLTVIVPC